MSTISQVVLPAVKHSILRTISVVGVLLVVAGLGWAVYAGIIRPVIKPTPSTHQSGVITNNYINPTADQLTDIINAQVKKQQKKFFVGVTLFGFDLGISK